tara:strand:- start:1201 stop:1467 length:267 start_codon:yes stop_codon:yes gene_type:complete
MNIKPKLVDPAWLLQSNLFPKPKIKIIKKPIIIDTKSNNSFIINIVGFMILIIGGICLYQRLREREMKRIDNQNAIIGFNEYVKEYIK